MSSFISNFEPGWNGERTWSAIIFRREMDGWKKLSLVGAAPKSPSASVSSHHRNGFSPVIPRVGCVVLPAVRQKWTLTNGTHTGTVIRRNDKLLLHSHGSVRILMLQFASLEDCLSFSDRFVALNPRACLSQNGEARRSDPVVQPPEERNDMAQQQQENVNQDQYQSESNLQQLMVNGLVTRLLHDDEFLRFVHKMEKYIMGTEDGAKMMEGLRHRDLSSL
jgi:hypothetical protein